MTIERGVEWGSAGALPSDAPVAASDAELARLVTDSVLRGERAPAVGLVGGDLCRTVGGLGEPARLRSGHARLLPVDALIVSLDGRPGIVAAAHVVIGAMRFRGPLVAAMNAQFVGRFDVAPRSHPNDGRVDVVDASALGWRDRLKAWRRLPTGAHVPHPQIEERRLTHVALGYERRVPVRVDGVEVGVAAAVEIRVVADAITIVV